MRSVPRVPRPWRCGRRGLETGPRTCLMGILNVTPDSFSDGGAFPDSAAAIARGLEMFAEGADIVDVGAESTRPGAAPVPPGEEWARLEPVLRGLRARTEGLLSVDTRKAAVARAALEAGADIVNDISALGDPAMAGAVREAGAGLVLMHMQGEPGTMQRDPVYGDVVGEVGAFLTERFERALAAGLAPEQIVLDPGIGFGKRPEHNRTLLARLDALRVPPRPLLLGVSRKSVVGGLTGRETGGRLAGSLALLAWLVAKGAAVLRVHDVKESCDAARVVDSMMREEARHGLD